jgi:hypothetical protein
MRHLKPFLSSRIHQVGALVPGTASQIHGMLSTTHTLIVSMIWVCMYELERLVEGVPFEVLNQERDSVRIGPCFAPVVAAVICN